MAQPGPGCGCMPADAPSSVGSRAAMHRDWCCTCQSFRPPMAATGPTTGQLAALRALIVAR